MYWVCDSRVPLFLALQLRSKGGSIQGFWPRHPFPSAVQSVTNTGTGGRGGVGGRGGGVSAVGTVHNILLRLWVGESVMTSLQGAGPRLRLAVVSKWRAISSAMKVLRSTSCRPFLRRLRGCAGWVGELGAPERTEILAMAPLRPGWRSERWPMR